MIVFREREADPKAEKRKNEPETLVTVDFDEGMTAAQVSSIKKKVREASTRVAEAYLDEVVNTSRGRNAKP